MADNTALVPRDVDETLDLVAPEDLYVGLSLHRVTDEEAKILIAPLTDDEVEILPTGELYMSAVNYRRRLTAAFGPGGWAMRPLTKPALRGNQLMQEWALYVYGHFVASAYGECEYQPDNARMTYGDVIEGAKSNAVMRCCFDSDTEVLTSLGFLRFANVGDAKIMQVTEGGLQAVDATPFSLPYSGEMITYDSIEVNFSVTPNHRMLTTKGIVDAETMYQTSRSHAVWKIPHRLPLASPSNDKILSLLGYVIADGTRYNRNGWLIKVSRPHKVSILKALGLHRREGVKQVAGDVAISSGGMRVITKNDQSVFVYESDLLDRFLTPDKQIRPEAILSLSPGEARTVVDAWRQFDGNFDVSEDARRLYCTDLDRLGVFEVLAIQAGYSVSIRRERILLEMSDLTNYNITLSTRDPGSVRRWGDKHNSHPSLRRTINNSSLVWCVTVPSGVIVVRRNGFSMLCGNCKDYSVASECWDKRFIDRFRPEHCVQVWVDGKNRPQWRRKDSPPFYKEKGPVEQSAGGPPRPKAVEKTESAKTKTESEKVGETAIEVGNETAWVETPPPAEEPKESTQEKKAPVPLREYTIGELNYRDYFNREDPQTPFVQVSMGGVWRLAHTQIDPEVAKKLTGLFPDKDGKPNEFEVRNHVKKHFEGNDSIFKLTYEEAAALYRWKKEGVPDSRWYADKIEKRSVGVTMKEFDSVEEMAKRAYYLDTPTFDDDSRARFLLALSKMPDPTVLQDLFDRGWNMKRDREHFITLAELLGAKMFAWGDEACEAAIESVGVGK